MIGNAGICSALALLLFISCPLLFPQIKKETGTKGRAIFRVPVNVVVLNATVTDKDGNPVTDLTANDFRVYDDDVLQNIQTFALESFGSSELEETKTDRTSPTPVLKKEKETQPRLISIVIDDLTMPSLHNFPLVVEAVKEFVRNSMGPTDQVAILSGSRIVKVPFSDNKEYLLEALAAVPSKLNIDTIPRVFTDLEAYYLSDMMRESNSPHWVQLIRKASAWMADASEGKRGRAAPLRPSNSAEAATTIAAKVQFGNIEFRYRNLLETLRQNIRALRHFEGFKTLVLFSYGFLAQSEMATTYQLQEVIDLALRSGIVLNTLSIRDVTTSMSNDPSEIMMHEEDKRAQESPLIQMASDTGGMFSHRRNDLAKGLREIASRQSYYYILTYNMPPKQADGSYHKIRMEVTRPGMVLSYRKGYYTPKEQLTFHNTRKTDIIDALDTPGDMNEIPMTLAYNYTQEEDYSYTVSFVTGVDIQKLSFLEEDARRKNTVSLILAAYDEADNFIDGLDKSIEFRLQEGNYVELRNQGLTSKVELKLPTGRYKIKAVVREHNQGKMGLVTKSVEIP
ncbi:MAG: VWA domain-containing protein [Acidobacteria bacterium]|nr:VWA domain-containing protein [Acidobacteriota bacterium]